MIVKKFAHIGNLTTIKASYIIPLDIKILFYLSSTYLKFKNQAQLKFHFLILINRYFNK